MKINKLMTIMTLIAGLSTLGMTAYAAPETMPDGTVFDAEYYAETYADVKAVFGNDKQALYNHYLQFGKNEGRTPCVAVASPVDNANLVYFYETWGAACKTYRVEKYSNGIWVSRVIEGTEICDPKYWIMRTDYSDEFKDIDGNGIDDRDPYNNCGYTDLDHNCMADGAPTYEGYVSEAEHTPFWTCRHGIINGGYICQQAECEAFREMMRSVRIR